MLKCYFILNEQNWVISLYTAGCLMASEFWLHSRCHDIKWFGINHYKIVHSYNYHLKTSIKKIQLFSLQMIINSYQNKSLHAVDTLTGLLIDLIDNFDIANIIWMHLYIRDWKTTSRYPKFRYIEIWDKRR
jgi:hypothetical protein